MALGEREKSPIEIWQERCWCALGALVLTVLYLLLFAEVLVPHLTIGLPLAPIIAFYYWRAMAWLLIGIRFDIALTTNPRDTAELWSIIITVLYGINVLVFVTSIISWYRG